MKNGLLLILSFIIFKTAPAQLGFAVDRSTGDTSHPFTPGESPYKLNLKIDIPVAVLGVTGTVVSYPLRNKKPKLDTAEVLALKIDDLAKFNRDAAHQYSKSADQVSDAIFYSGFAIPMLLALDKPVRHNALAVTIMYFETMGIAGTLDGFTNGNVKKLRPYVYNPDVPLKPKLESDASGSFYGSHPSFTAACSFFLAKVYSDYHPSSRFRYVVWPAAGAVTLASSYFRYKGGHHFISDIAVGVGVGTAIGIGVPALHKQKHDRLSIGIIPGDQKQLAVAYRF